jgi:hypothetical protein
VFYKLRIALVLWRLMGVFSPERQRARERTAPEPAPAPGAPQPPPAAPPEREPAGRDWSRWAPGLLVAGLLVVAAAGLPNLGSLLPSFPNPFGTETVDRSGPAVLKSLRDLQEYRAASGHFEVIVDLEKDTKLPSGVLGERILFVGVGDVEAGVDFSTLDEGAVDVSNDRRTATITLPRPQLSEPRLDLERSYVYDRSQGVLNEIGLLFQDERNTEREVYLLAEQKLAEAARDGSGVIARAEANTREMLTSLLRSLGFRSVTVRFAAPPQR